MKTMKIEYETNKWVADAIVSAFPQFIIAAEATKEENYDVDDIRFTAATYSVHALENKTLKGGYKFKEDGEFRDYFTKDIYKKLKFERDITSGTPVYFVNAEDAYHNMSNGKWQKLLDNNACLSFLAPDGIYIFSPKTLRDAFVGYADYWVSHTTDLGKTGPKHPEKKAVLDMSKATHIPCNPPERFFKK